jgi:hypothetical protein
MFRLNLFHRRPGEFEFVPLILLPQKFWIWDYPFFCSLSSVSRERESSMALVEKGLSIKS